MGQLPLTELRTGCVGLTAAAGTVLYEAAAFCFSHNEHVPGVSLLVHGHHVATYSVEWEPVTDQMRRTFADFRYAAEHGAYGIAILVTKRATGLSVVQRSRQGTGFDYWLGVGPEPIFQARLEVTGILNARGLAWRLLERMRQKREQVARSDRLPLPAYVVVVEFGHPQVLWEQHTA